MSFPPFIRRRRTSAVAAAIARIKALGPVELHLPGDFVKNGAAISQLNDSSASALHPSVQATGVAQPIWNADGSWTYDGIAQFTAALYTLPQPCTFLIRVKQITWINNRGICDGGISTVALLQNSTSTPNFRLFVNGSSGALNGNLAVATYGTVAAIINGNTSSTQVDANAPVIDTGGSVSAVGGLTLGGFGGGSGFSNTKFSFAAAFPFVLTAPQIAQAQADIAIICAGIT